MGAFSKVQRFHEAGQGANVNNIDRFGVPAYSLYTSTKVFSLHHRIEITDENKNVVYRSNAKVISLHDKTELYKASGEHVAHIERKLISLHERHYVTMDSGLHFEISNELFHIIKDVTNIIGLDWQLRGNILALNFELYDKDGSVIAVIGQKWISIHDKYCIDIYRPEYEEIIVAVLVTLQHMIRDREASRSSGSSGGSSSGN